MSGSLLMSLTTSIGRFWDHFLDEKSDFGGEGMQKVTMRLYWEERVPKSHFLN